MVLCAPAPALAAGGHVPVVSADVLGIGGLVSGVFSSIGHAVVGAFSWTVGLAGQFILVTVGALVRLLIPHSWVHAGVQIMRWIVAVPDYAGQVTTPTGHHVYGFAGINDLRDVFAWLGIAIAPLTLVYATTRAMIGDGDPIAIPVLRIAAATVAIASYPYWWTQAAAAADQVTNVILSVPAVSAGLYRLMDYAVAGVALGGWQLIDLGLMAATALALLALIFLKVVLILLGALLYATGPVMIGLVPTRAGAALARAWASAAAMLLGLGIAWATVFAVGRVVDRRLDDRRAADRRQHHVREPGRRAAARRRRGGEPVGLSEGGPGGRRDPAHAAVRPAGVRRRRRRVRRLELRADGPGADHGRVAAQLRPAADHGRQRRRG